MKEYLGHILNIYSEDYLYYATYKCKKCNSFIFYNSNNKKYYYFNKNNPFSSFNECFTLTCNEVVIKKLLE